METREEAIAFLKETRQSVDFAFVHLPYEKWREINKNWEECFFLYAKLYCFTFEDVREIIPV